MFWEWGPDTCDNVNVTVSPSLSLADVISPPFFPLISSTIRGYILLASWRMVCVACAHKNQSGLSIDLAPVLSTRASLGQGYQDNPTSSSHLFRLSPTHPSLQPTIGILFSQYNRRIGFFLGHHKFFLAFELPLNFFIHHADWKKDVFLFTLTQVFDHSGVWCVGGCPEQPTLCPPFSPSVSLVTLSSLWVSQSCKQHWGPGPHSHPHSQHDQ